MTRQRIIGRDTAYIDWLRTNPKLDSQEYGYDRGDIDIVWFAYRRGLMMLIEEKCYAGQPTKAQRDTHGILHQALKFSCSRMKFRRYFPSRTRQITYYGYHLVQFEKTCPTDGWIKIDGDIVSADQLLAFHQFDLDAFPKGRWLQGWPKGGSHAIQPFT
jgi:hypothetical protein